MMKISELIEFLEKTKESQGDLPIYKTEHGGQGIAWEIFELNTSHFVIESNIEDWGKIIERCLVLK